MATRRLAELSTVILTLALAPALLAQDFDISWYTIDGGGEMFTSGGDFELSGTIGQPDAGAMTGGDFELVGGFWAVGGGDNPPCDPCDMNCDGTVDAGDIEFFIDILFAGATPCGACTGDTNDDGFVDAADIEGFIDCLFP
ncbi:MAG: hypothetical protein IID33_13745 [Planctomycetes bacterium]|nr:hypothetical protein [Planctomycetota bacterium]